MKSISLTVVEQFACNTAKLGSRDLAKPPLRYNFKGDLSGLSQGTCLSN